MESGMEKMAPPPVPTHKRPEMTVREEIWRGESVRKGCPMGGDRHVLVELQGRVVWYKISNVNIELFFI